MKYQNREEFEKQNMFGTGAANTAFAQYFIGESFLNPLADPEGGLFAANVTFELGCRCVPPVRAGIRRRASPPSACTPARSS